MLTDDLFDRLKSSAEHIGKGFLEDPALISPNFRGRPSAASDFPLPQLVRGVRIGAYPVLVGELTWGGHTSPDDQVRAFHSQMVIARSFMRSDEVIDAHIFLAISLPPEGSDWRQKVDAIERDESVCRKIIWIADPSKLDGTYARFLERTFLSRPWADLSTGESVALDQNESVVQRELIARGLTPESADRWAKLASTEGGDPSDFVEQLVSAMEVQS